MNHGALCQPGLVGQEDGWGSARTSGLELGMLISEGRKETHCLEKLEI